MTSRVIGEDMADKKAPDIDLGYVDDDGNADDLDEAILREQARDPGYRGRAVTLSALLDVLFQLRRRRMELGLTLQELAERTGDSAADLEDLEDNNIDASADLIRRYADAVGLRLEYRLAVSA